MYLSVHKRFTCNSPRLATTQSSSVGERTEKKLRYSHTVGEYSEIKWKELLIHATIQVISKQFCWLKGHWGKKHILNDLIYLNFRKYKLIYNKRKQISGFLEREGTSRVRKEGVIRHDRYFNYGDGFRGIYKFQNF